MIEMIRTVERVARMRDDLGLIPVVIEIGEEGGEQLTVDWTIWPEEGVEEEDANYIKRMIFQYRAALETGEMEPDEEVFDDFANLIALHVLLYEELVADRIPDHIEQAGNEAWLKYFKSFFESDERLEQMLWGYAANRMANFLAMLNLGMADRWAKIGGVIAGRIQTRGVNLGE